MRVRREALRSSFWLASAIVVPLAIVLAFGLTALERGTKLDLGLFGLSDQASARAVLQTIATATVSVAGLSFSVTLVALTLAAQQLSPRVLRTFRSDRIAQVTLAGFLGTFAYSLVVLARLGQITGPRVPELSVGLAIVFALAAFGGFVAFIGDIVKAVQASTVIRRIAADAHQAIDGRHPRTVGAPPDDPGKAERQVRERIAAGRRWELRTRRAGYLTHVDASLVERAAQAGVLVVQRVAVGDLLVTGQLLAEVIGEGDDTPPLNELCATFRLGQERTLAADVAFPVRQLADIALRALSPGVNDPTTAENAMGSLADTVVRVAGDEPVSAVRVDAGQTPRLHARPTSLDELVHLGFEQVRHAAPDPLMAAQLISLLEEIARASRDAGSPSEEAARQLALFRSER